MAGTLLRAERSPTARADGLGSGLARRRTGESVAERLVLHIGAMKTGTTFLQSALQANQAAHDAAGFRFLADFGAQARAVRRVLAAPTDPARHGDWCALLEEARRFDGEA